MLKKVMLVHFKKAKVQVANQGQSLVSTGNCNWFISLLWLTLTLFYPFYIFIGETKTKDKLQKKKDARYSRVF